MDRAVKKSCMRTTGISTPHDSDCFDRSRAVSVNDICDADGVGMCSSTPGFSAVPSAGIANVRFGGTVTTGTQWIRFDATMHGTEAIGAASDEAFTTQSSVVQRDPFAPAIAARAGARARADGPAA